MFEKLKLRRHFKKVGSSVDVQYLLYVNNIEPICFSSQDDCISYLTSFRKDNPIFKLMIYRVETFSLFNDF